MNAPIRRVSTFLAALFGALLISTTLIQFVWARDLNARPDNRRTVLATFAQERGQILVGDTAIARSDPVKDQYKFQRVYPEGEEYAHITGWFSFFGVGGGLEQAENALLSGRSDKLFYRRVSDLFTGRKPQGASLELTINPKVQEAAIEGLNGQKGAAVALDPRTGAILAMVSIPSYDPSVLASHDLKAAAKASEKLNSDPDKALINRAIEGNLYPPGSTFKVVTAAAALESGRWGAGSQIPGPAALPLPQTTSAIHNSGGGSCGPNDQTTLANALTMSCNTAFAWLGMEVGADALREQAAKFGFGDSLSIPMRVVPSQFPAAPNEPQTAQSAIGQFDVKSTPLQMAMVAAGVANKGVVMKPYLVNSVVTPDLTTIESARPTQLSRAIDPEVAATLTSMMVSVVDEGTAPAARIPGIKVAGKTGTAQHLPGAAPHAWFISFAPADKPTVAVAVVVENGGKAGNEAYGGTVAAPIARAMMEAAITR